MKNKKPISNWGLALAVAYELIGATVVGIYLGRWLDQDLGWKPWGSVVGIGVPFVAVLVSMVIKFSRANNRDSP